MCRLTNQIDLTIANEVYFTATRTCDSNKGVTVAHMNSKSLEDVFSEVYLGTTIYQGNKGTLTLNPPKTGSRQGSFMEGSDTITINSMKITGNDTVYTNDKVNLLICYTKNKRKYKKDFKLTVSWAGSMSNWEMKTECPVKFYKKSYNFSLIGVTPTMTAWEDISTNPEFAQFYRLMTLAGIDDSDNDNEYVYFAPKNDSLRDALDAIEGSEAAGGGTVTEVRRGRWPVRHRVRGLEAGAQETKGLPMISISLYE